MEKQDYSAICDMNDDNMDNPCEKCKYGVFPIGCMKGDVEEEPHD